MKPMNFPEMEAELLKVWDKEQTFQKSLEQRQGAKRFSFYDGPPFANGLPHYGHVVAVTQKDAITRYKTMRGYYVPRRNGWDTHGLPVEYEVEKALGISGKRQILEMGIDKFVAACRASVFKYKQDWEEFMRRLGRWADTDSYATLDDNYIESVWWVLKSLHEKGLVYQGFKSMPYCPRCATPLSNFEVNQNYKDDVEDPSVYVTFPLVDEPDVSLLAWTTTPWTLPANAALAVEAKADYVKVQVGDQKLIVAKLRLNSLKDDKAKVLETFKGKELVGRAYKPLYEFASKVESEKSKVHHVYADESVSLEDGTGILHVAPRYGETDLLLGQKENLPLIESVDGNGIMTVDPGKGLFFKDADPLIVEDLTKAGRIFAAEKFTHTYPFCWRCETPLLYFATPSWFVKVTELSEKLVKNNDTINWVPEHIKQGRFGNWLADARDWGISRNRFWGAPIPIWVCKDEHVNVIGSIDDLKKQAINPEAVSDLHRPGIDGVKVKCSECGKEATRVEEVFDCWFESGSMPYGQDHYPFENKQEVETNFPADFIAEGLDQTRGWFYTLHVLATALFDKPAFQNVVVNGIVLAADGQKLSKRLKNYPPVEEVFAEFGADTLRFFMMTSPVVMGEDVRFGKDTLGDVYRNVFMTLWNVFSFYKTYSHESLVTSHELNEPKSDNLLDQWLISKLNALIAETTKQADAYQIARAARPLREFIDDLSNWYVRRSRRRFGKNADPADRAAATATLHYVLARTAQLFAPWAPFISDKLYRELTGQSVHLSDWPEAGKVNQELLDQMDVARQVVTDALAARAEAGIKVRMPLSKVKGPAMPKDLKIMVQEEVNVKEYQEVKGPVEIDIVITPELKLEGMARDIIRLVQNERKLAGMQVGDQVELALTVGNDDENRAAQVHRQTITGETGAIKIEIKSGDKLAARVEKV